MAVILDKHTANTRIGIFHYLSSQEVLNSFKLTTDPNDWIDRLSDTQAMNMIGLLGADYYNTLSNAQGDLIDRLDMNINEIENYLKITYST
jgi:hypothetical protein